MIRLWESLVRARLSQGRRPYLWQPLSEARRRDFMARPEAAKLADYAEPVLRRAAKIAMVRRQGDLDLRDWLTACEERHPIGEEEVIRIWETVVRHRLSDGRREEFRQRSETQQLAEYAEPVLRRAAEIVMVRNLGDLLLKDWLKACREARALLSAHEGF